jgi:hypothetical protein
MFGASHTKRVRQRLVRSDVGPLHLLVRGALVAFLWDLSPSVATPRREGCG